jgi:hypothetical protein
MDLKGPFHFKGCKSILDKLENLSLTMESFHKRKAGPWMNESSENANICRIRSLICGNTDDLWIKVAEYLDGPELNLLGCINRQLRQIMQMAVIWQTACKSLTLFCEDPLITVVARDVTSWRAVYWALRHESYSILKEGSAGLVLPRCPELKISSTAVEFTGSIGKDRAVRAPEGWTVPPPSRKGPLITKKSRWISTWRVPPILITCPVQPGTAEYVFAECRYYEVSVMKPKENGCSSDSGAGPSWCVAVGLSTVDFSLEGMQPGWDSRSCAYHSDDGHVFFGNERIMSLPRFGAGDTVGCGLRRDGRLFFTRNGRVVGVAPPLPANFWARVRKGRERGLFPTVGLDTPCPLRINCGRSPFVCGEAELRRTCEASDISFHVAGQPARRLAAGTLLDCRCAVS